MKGETIGGVFWDSRECCQERERGKNGAGFKKLKSCKFYEIISFCIRIENVQCDIITKTKNC